MKITFDIEDQNRKAVTDFLRRIGFNDVAPLVDTTSEAYQVLQTLIQLQLKIEEQPSIIQLNIKFEAKP